MCTVCLCVCTFCAHIMPLEGLRVGVEQEAQMGPGGLRAEEKKGVCRGGNNRWTCSGGYGVSLIAHRPHLLICSNYLPTQWAPCQHWGVNTTDQIHLKIREPTHSATPTQAFYGGLTSLNACVWRRGAACWFFHVNKMWKIRVRKKY